MSASVGRVNLDIGLNQNSLQKEIRGIGSKYKKDFQSMGNSLGKSLGGTLSVAFGNMISGLVQTAVKNIGSFISSSIDLGSSIAELENVTSTVFPSMTSQLEAFSKSALQQYGLTEMQTKKMMGTFGAMAQSFNYTEKESYAMSSALTGLVGDVASFYNLEHDVAYTKIKSVFTGETESLKELGIVMTQTALDEFAMQQGMAKTTKEMNEQEKVALRMAFVTEKLGFAAGDFNKTQNQWANQTRILQGQWDSFKAALGQGFIAVLTPVIQGLNQVMAVVVKLGEKFRDFINLIMGNDTASSGSGALMQEVADVTTAAGDTAETASDQASSAAKKVQKSLMGFDKLNKLSAPDSSSGSGGSGAGSSSPTGSTPVGNTKKETDSVVGALDTLKGKLNDIANWTGLDKLWEGIKTGISKINFSSIKTNFKTIFTSLKPIAESAFNGLGVIMRSYMNFLGTMLGEVVSYAGKAIEIASGAVSRWLSVDGNKISNWFTNTSSTIASGYDNFAQGIQNVSSSLMGAINNYQPELEASLAGWLANFSDFGMLIGTVFSDMWEGVSKGFLDFTTENKPLMDDFFNGLIESCLLWSNTFSGAVSDINSSLSGWWEGNGKRIWGEIVDVFYDLVGWVMKIWNEIVKPVIDHISEAIDELWNEHGKPLWDEVLAFITSLWDAIKAIWDNALKPIVNWLIEKFGPPIVKMFKNIIDNVKENFGMIMDVIKGVIKSLRGILDFITGVFTGDWKKAWGGIKTFFGGIWDAIWSIIKRIINKIIDGLNSLWSGLYKALAGIVNGVGSLVEKLGEAIGQDWGFSIPKDPPLIPKLAEGGYVRANQPQLAMIGDNKRHGEIVAPEDKLYEIVSKALQAFMGQLIMALNANNPGSKKANEMMQLIIQLGEETIVNRIIKMVNAESRRQGTSVIKI